MLTDERILGLRDQLFQLLQTSGLATLATDYVSTRGGERRERMWIPAREFLGFARDYLVTNGLAGNLWSRELEERPSAFHTLQPRGNYMGLRDELEITIPVGLREEVGRFLDQCESSSMLEQPSNVEVQGFLEVRDRLGYQEALSQAFHRPLVDFLFDQTGTTPVLVPVPVPTPVPTPVPDPPKQVNEGVHSITFPPFDDGMSLVFGRDSLKDKIALGYETSKGLTPESIVSWDIHSVDEPFICTFQQIGMGKSTLANCIMLQAAFQGIPVVVFDPKPDYISSLVPVAKTIERMPDYRTAIEERFQIIHQDIQGFELDRPVEFEHDGRQLQLKYQIYSFAPGIEDIGGRALKVPLVVLPPAGDSNFGQMCDSAATSLAMAIHRQWQQQAYNTTLSQVFRRFHENNPAREFILPDELTQELVSEIEAASSRSERTRIERLLKALQGYCTAQSWMFAQSPDEITRPEDLVQNPLNPDGDGKTVTISVLDLSRLTQEKGNPAKMNYVSNVCGNLYNLATRRMSDRPAQFLVVMDEAANYLPKNTDQFNNTLTLIRQGRSLGVRVWLVAQSPGQIEIQARNQAFRMVLSQIPHAAIRHELTRWNPDDAWREKLAQTGKGEALVMDRTTAPEGGVLCTLFTSPQTVNLLSQHQVMEIIKG